MAGNISFATSQIVLQRAAAGKSPQYAASEALSPSGPLGKFIAWIMDKLSGGDYSKRIYTQIEHESDALYQNIDTTAAALSRLAVGIDEHDTAVGHIHVCDRTLQFAQHREGVTCIDVANPSSKIELPGATIRSLAGALIHGTNDLKCRAVADTPADYKLSTVSFANRMLTPRDVARIDRDGGSLVDADFSSDEDWSDLQIGACMIDQFNAQELIEAGADPTAIVNRLLECQNVQGLSHVDLTGLDLSRVNPKNVDFAGTTINAEQVQQMLLNGRAPEGARLKAEGAYKTLELPDGVPISGEFAQKLIQRGAPKEYVLNHYIASERDKGAETVSLEGLDVSYTKYTGMTQVRLAQPAYVS